MKQLISTDDYEEYKRKQWKNIDRIYELKLFSKHVDIIEQLLPNITNLEKKKVLCVGARYGIEVEVFKQLGFSNITAVDIYPRADFIIKGDMHQLPFSDNCFDIIYSHHSLDHALFPQKALDQFYRVSRNNAFWVLSIPYNDFGPEEAIDFDSPDEIKQTLDNYSHKIVFEQAVWRDKDLSIQPRNTWLPEGWQSELRIIIQISKT